MAFFPKIGLCLLKKVSFIVDVSVDMEVPTKFGSRPDPPAGEERQVWFHAWMAGKIPLLHAGHI